MRTSYLDFYPMELSRAVSPTLQVTALTTHTYLLICLEEHIVTSSKLNPSQPTS